MTQPSNTTTRKSRAQRLRSLCVRDLESWPGVDPAAITDARNRQRFLRLQHSIEMFANGADLTDVLAVAKVSARWWHRLLKSCQTHGLDGRLRGWRALVWRECRVKSIRKHPRRPNECCATAGYAGLFGKLLHDHPGIERALSGALARKGSKHLMPNRLNFRGAHLAFIAACRDSGIGEDEYPLNTQAQGRRALKQWLEQVFIPRHATSWLAHEEGPGAAQASAYGSGSGQDTRLEEPYLWWQIDEATIDVLARYEIPNETGDWDEVELDRFMVIHVVAMGSSASLAWSMVLARQVGAADLFGVIWQALSGQPKAPAAIPNLDYKPGGGFPAKVFPQLQYLVPSVIFLDNALAHLAASLQKLIAVHFGAVVRVGRPGTPQERATIESNIKQVTWGLLRQVPGATGSSPTEGLRKRTNLRAKKRLVVREVEHSIDVYLANKNGLPNSACRGISSLERLGRQLDAGAIQGAYLPTTSRRAHLFFQAYRATVRINPKSGRGPHINFEGVRYTSTALANAYGLAGKQFVVHCDPRDLRMVWLYDPVSGVEFGAVTAVGRWGKFPHDLRIRKLYLKLKREAALGEHAEDEPLELLYQHLRDRAPTDRRAATRLAYVLHFLEGWAEPPQPAAQQASLGWRQAQESANEPLPLTDHALPALPARAGGQMVCVPEADSPALLVFPSAMGRRVAR